MDWFKRHCEAIERLHIVAESLDRLSGAFRTVGNDKFADDLEFYAGMIDRQATEAKDAVSQYITEEVKAQQKALFGTVGKILNTTEEGDK